MLIEKDISINRSITDVYKYVLDFSQLYEWDDHVMEGQRVDLGPIQVGSKFCFVYSFFGHLQELECTLKSIKPENLLLVSCEAPSFKAVNRITFQRSGDKQTKITYRVEIDVQSKIKALLFFPFMEKIGSRVVTRLKECLENEETIYPKNKPLTLLNLSFRFTMKGWNYRRKQFSATSSQPKTVLITGATSGLGKSVAFSLAGKGCNLLLVGRNQEKIRALESDLREQGFDKEIRIYICDMQNLHSVHQMCTQIITERMNIDVLINNAGALFAEAFEVEGIERTTVVDLIAPWIISCKLLQQIRTGGCIINVSSGGMYSCALSLSKLKIPDEPFSGSKAYAMAKRAMVVASRGLNAHTEPKGIRVHCMQPGWADTPGILNSLPNFHKLTKRWLRTPFQGADTIVWLAMRNPQAGGQFWLDRQIQPHHILKSTEIPESSDQELREFLETFSKPNAPKD